MAANVNAAGDGGEELLNRQEPVNRKASFSDTLNKFASSAFSRRRNTTDLPKSESARNIFQASRLPTPGGIARSSSFFGGLSAFSKQHGAGYSKLSETDESGELAQQAEQPTTPKHSRKISEKLASTPFFRRDHQHRTSFAAVDSPKPKERRNSGTQIKHHGLMQPIPPPLPRSSTLGNLGQSSSASNTPGFMRPTTSSAARRESIVMQQGQKENPPHVGRAKQRLSSLSEKSGLDISTPSKKHTSSVAGTSQNTEAALPRLIMADNGRMISTPIPTPIKPMSCSPSPEFTENRKDAYYQEVVKKDELTEAEKEELRRYKQELRLLNRASEAQDRRIEYLEKKLGEDVDVPDKLTQAEVQKLRHQTLAAYNARHPKQEPITLSVSPFGSKSAKANEPRLGEGERQAWLRKHANDPNKTQTEHREFPTAAEFAEDREKLIQAWRHKEAASKENKVAALKKSKEALPTLADIPAYLPGADDNDRDNRNFPGSLDTNKGRNFSMPITIQGRTYTESPYMSAEDQKKYAIAKSVQKAMEERRERENKQRKQEEERQGWGEPEVTPAKKHHNIRGLTLPRSKAEQDKKDMTDLETLAGKVNVADESSDNSDDSIKAFINSNAVSHFTPFTPYSSIHLTSPYPTSPCPAFPFPPKLTLLIWSP